MIKSVSPPGVVARTAREPSRPMSDVIFDAIEFAARAHRGQFRKATPVPYIVHPLAVAEALIGWGATAPVVAAGLLHDVVEDTEVTLDDVARAFGPEVAALVAVVTEPDKALPWEARKEHTIAALRAGPAEAIAIACADKLDNLRTMRATLAAEGEAALWARFKRGREQQRWYYESIAAVARDRAPDAPWTREYTRAVAALFQPPPLRA